MYEDSHGYLWVGTWGGGLNKFDREKEEFKHYKKEQGDPNSLRNDSVGAIFEDSEGILWIGTWGGGLSKFDRENEQFTHYQYDPNDPNSIGNNVVRTIYEDKSGILWIGVQSGVSKFDKGKEILEQLMREKERYYKAYE